MLALLLCWLALAGPAPAEVRLWRAPAAYDVDSTVLLNDAARRDKEVGYKLRARLALLPEWRDPQDDHHVLLRLELEAPQLLGRGKHPNAEYATLPSLWDERPRSVFYARWRRGRVLAAYLDPADHPDVLNFKRSLISLFQFQVLEGWGNETDASGECEVHYESPSPTTVRKTKRRCRAPAWELHDDAAPDDDDEHDEDDEVQSRRLTRYSLSAALDALLELHAEELHELGAPVAGAGLKARAFMRLTHAPAPPAPAPAPHAPAASLSAALAALPAALQPTPLTAAPPPDLRDTNAQDDDDEVVSDDELGALAEEAAGALPGHGGTLTAARAAHALRAAPPERLARLLHDAQPRARLAGLCAALGLLGSAPAHAAAVAFLRLRERDAPADLAHAYFAALAHAPRVPAAVLDDALRLGAELRDAALAESALLAAAAAAQRAPADAQRRVRDALARALRLCADDECRRVRVAALGNLRRADTAELLLTHAEAEGGSEAALAALDALDALLTARGSLPGATLGRLERVALGGSGAALEARAAALDLLLRAAAPAPFSLARVLLALHAARERELLRLAWARLDALGSHEAVRLLRRVLPARLRGWDGAAAGGTSSLLERRAGGAAGWAARLESRQVASGALLRRGRVRLLTSSPRNRTDDTLSVELWTRGLGALGGAADEAELAEPAGGGLALRVGGALLPALTLFRGQAELLAHVWAGTASEPVPALRAVRALPGAARALPLLGGAALRYSRAATAAVALDAEAQVSLWSRTARTRTALRTALWARGAARVRAAWGALHASAASELEPRLRIDADLDFYDAPALCVRAAVAPHERAYNVTLVSRLGGARSRTVRRTRHTRWRAEGHTLALGAPNDATCRAMGASRD